MPHRITFLFLISVLCSGCLLFEQGAKFEPADGEVILFVGQELDAIGGLEDYYDGYLDHFEAPAGFTMYTGINTETGRLDGIYSTDNWGDGESNISLQLRNESFDDMALAIGLSMVGEEGGVADGTHDKFIRDLGIFMISLRERPVFLRIGYEFAGEWNNYDRENYIKAFRRIRDAFEEMGVENVAYVWQSHGWGLSVEELETWYPGDDYVDWCGYSFFSRFEESNMIEFARAKGKPVFIAEATPAISADSIRINGQTEETILSNPEQAEEAWEQWFEPFFRTIDENPDVIKAVSYINANWRSRRMWQSNPSFQGLDSRLQTSEMISERWKEITNDPKYLKASPDLFDYLNDQN
jgi:hypothetical protein